MQQLRKQQTEFIFTTGKDKMKLHNAYSKITLKKKI